ncbi:MAG TPA: sigma-54 dependent transcriptional regulator [Spirochaetia bacterium]|nr:sigma-54 dependent transcriptional regulator [Spirochaetia bacterium]
MPGEGHRVLVVDDDEIIRKLMRDLLEVNHYEVEDASDVAAASGKLRDREYEVVLTDLMLPDGSGLDVLHAARSRPYQPEVLLITAYGTIDSAVEAVRGGAFDYLTKPLSTQKLLLAVERAIERRNLRREVDELRSEMEGRYAPQNIVAVSPGMRKVLEMVNIVRTSDSSVLIQGESGTGKELVARAIHYRGPRAPRPFIALNCAALPEALLESELFGHVKGAFTGANTDKKGLFEEADGGTLLLDEIGDMPPALQAKLLRVLQEGEVRRVGSTSVRKVDVRIIASTNKDLASLIAQGSFREDLYYRLAVIPIAIPPLRERREDIEPLCRHFMAVHSAKLGRDVPGLDPRAMESMMDYSWPGNVRELENVIARAMTLSSAAHITREEFSRIFSLGRASTRQAGVPDSNPPAAPEGESQEREAILQALQQGNGNQTKAARILGIGRNTLWRKMKKYRIEASQ